MAGGGLSLPLGQELAGGEGWHGGHQSQVFGVEAEKSHPWIPPRQDVTHRGCQASWGAAGVGTSRGESCGLGSRPHLQPPSLLHLREQGTGSRPLAAAPGLFIAANTPHAFKPSPFWGDPCLLKTVFPPWDPWVTLSRSPSCAAAACRRSRCCNEGATLPAHRHPREPTCLGGEVTSPAPLSLLSPPPVTPPSWR